MRAIDGDALKRKAQKVATEAWKMKLTAKVETTLNQFIDWIDAAQTVEPERKKGKWLIHKWTSDAQCSECKMYFKDVYDMENSDRFCRNCGTEMDGLKVVDE